MFYWTSEEQDLGHTEWFCQVGLDCITLWDQVLAIGCSGPVRIGIPMPLQRRIIGCCDSFDLAQFPAQPISTATLTELRWVPVLVEGGIFGLPKSKLRFNLEYCQVTIKLIMDSLTIKLIMDSSGSANRNSIWTWQSPIGT